MYLNFPFVSHDIPSVCITRYSKHRKPRFNESTYLEISEIFSLSADPEGARWVENSLDKESKLRGKNMGVDGLQTAGIIQLAILCGSNTANVW